MSATFKPIGTSPELKEFIAENQENVGVSKSGELYSYDFKKGSPKKLTIPEAAERLGLEEQTIIEIAKHKGNYDLPDPKPEPEPKVEQVVPTTRLEHPEQDPEPDTTETQDQQEPTKTSDCSCQCEEHIQVIAEHVSDLKETITQLRVDQEELKDLIRSIILE